MEPGEPDWLDYYSGGVPTGDYFRHTLDDIRKISRSDTERAGGINRLQELCFVGLISYFEAFCKDHFAFLLNLEPGLVTNLKAAGQDVSVDATHITLYGEQSAHRMGFVLASGYDFGTPKKINAVFCAALKITPFSKDEAQRLDAMLRDRHLLVHHGGNFTLKYLAQQGELEQMATDAFFNSRVIGQKEVLEAVDFIETMARKLLRSSAVALRKYLADRKAKYSGQREKALKGMTWWDDGEA